MSEGNEALELLDRLREELNATHGLFSKKPDIDTCADLCDRLVRVLPKTLEDAERIKRTRKDILANADVVAKNTIRAAEERADKLVGDTEVVKRAGEDANRIIENAYKRCDELVRSTKTHLDNLFIELEQFLLSTLAVVRKNREELRKVFTEDKRQ